MPQGDKMGRRLEMLLNVSVSGMQNVDKLSSNLKNNATSLREVTKGLVDVEGGADRAATNYAKFQRSAERVEKSQKELSSINQQIAKEQSTLSRAAQERSSIDTSVYQKAIENNRSLMETFKSLKSVYSRVSEQSSQTFEPLGKSALDAKVDVQKLKDELQRLEKSYTGREQAFKQPRDPRTGQFAKKDQPGGIDKGQEPQEFAKEQESLKQRIRLMDETIERTESLQQAQQRYAKDRQAVIQTNEAMARNAEKVGKSEARVKALTDTKRRLIGELRAEGNVLNELSGQQLVKYNQQTGQAAIKSRDIASIKKMTTKASRDLSRQLDDTSRATRDSGRSQSEASGDTRALKQQLEAQNQEWTVMRQRISRNNEALWGLRRQLGALRNQILVVLFATRGLRNMMTSARDTIIEVDQGMLGLRRTAVSMGEDFQHLERITRSFEERGLQNADEAALALRNILQTGMGVEEATNLLYVFTDAASFNARSQRDLTDSVVRASEAFRDQRAQGLQAIGISQRMTDMVREHAMATGQQTAEVTGAERHMAIYNAIMSDSAKFTDNANELLETYEGRLISLGGASKSTSEAMGELLRPAFMQFTKTLTEGHGRIQEFIGELKDANREDIDRWVLRLNKTFEIIMTTIGSVSGTIVRLIVSYGDLIGIITQMIVAKTLYNKILARSALKLDEARKAVEGYNIVGMEQASTATVTNKVTGEQVTGMQRIKLIYKKARVDSVNYVASLKAENAEKGINTTMIGNNKASMAKASVIKKAYLATTQKVSAAWGIMTAKGRALITSIQGLNAAVIKKSATTTFYNIKAKATSGLWATLSIQGIKLKAVFSALTVTVKAAGGAFAILTKAVGALMMMFGKLLILFAAVHLITRLITWLTRTKETTDELTMANERLSDSYEKITQSVDRAQKRLRDIAPEANVFGVDTAELKQTEVIIEQHYSRLRALKEVHNREEDEDIRAALKDNIEHYRESLQDQIDLLEQYSSQVNEKLDNIRSFRLDIEERYQDQVTSLMNEFGVKQLHEAKENQRQYEDTLKEHHQELESLMQSSALSRLRIERQIAFTRRNLQRQVQKEELELLKSWNNDINNLRIQTRKQELDDQKQTTEVIRQQYELRRLEERREHRSRVNDVKDQVRGQREMLEKELDGTINTILGVGAQVDREIQKVLLGIADDSNRERFKGFFESIQGHIEDVSRGIMESNTVEELDRWKDKWKDIDEAIEGVKDKRGLLEAFQPIIDELDDPTRNFIENLEEGERASELMQMTLRNLRSSYDRYNESVLDGIDFMSKNIKEQETLVETYRSTLDTLDDINDRNEKLTLNQKLREISTHNLNKALEEVEKTEQRLQKIKDTETEVRSIKHQIELNRLIDNSNTKLANSGSAHNELTRAIQESTQAQLEFKQNKEETLSEFNREININQRLVQELEDQLRTREELLDDDHKDEIQERINTILQEIEVLENLHGLTKENFKLEKLIHDHNRERAESQAALADLNKLLSDSQQEYNEKIQHHQELVDIQLEMDKVRATREELTLNQRFIPVLGGIFQARTKVINAQRIQQREHENELNNLRLQRTAVKRQLELAEEQLESLDKLKGVEKEQAQERVQQLETQVLRMNELIGATKDLMSEEEKRFEVQKNQDMTSALVDNLQPSIDMAHDYANSLRDVRQEILLDEHKFQLEYADQLRYGEINRSEHNQLMIASERHLQAKEDHLRQQRLASLVRDIGREISLYAARQAASSGNIKAAVGLLMGGAGIMVATNAIASRIERQSTMRFQQAEIEFQRAQSQIQQTESGTSGDDSRSRKFGGTIRADNLVVNISPTLIVDGEQIFIGSGSALEFSREVSELMLDSIQQAVDDRRLDLSNVPRNEG